jgi:hypothetical protein
MRSLDATSPIEVWLTKKNIEVAARAVFEDESTLDLNVVSLSMRGAQREITGHLLEWGYEPADRWTYATEDYIGTDEISEAVRKFRPAKKLDGAPTSLLP